MSRCAGGSRSGSRRAAGLRAGYGDPAGVEQAELELLPQHPGHRPVDDSRGHLAAHRQVKQRLAEAAGTRQLNVQSGG